MNGEALWDAFGEMPEQWLLAAEKRRTPKKKRLPPWEWAGAHIWMPVSVCALAVLAVLWIIPAFSGETPAPATDGSQVLQVQEHIHVIFRDYTQIRAFLDAPEEGEALEAYLQESGLWDQAIRDPQNADLLRRMLQSAQFPVLAGREPSSIEVLLGGESIAVFYEDVEFYIPWLKMPGNIAEPEGELVCTNPYLILTGEAEGRRQNAYFFTTCGNNALISVCVEAQSREGAVEKLKGLTWQYFTPSAAVPVIPEIDSWVGQWKDGSWSMEHVVAAESTVDVKVTDITVDRNASSHFGSAGTITLELTARTDQEVQIGLACFQSDDNFSDVYRRNVSLTAGEPVTVTLEFDGWAAFSYNVAVDVANVRIHLHVEPPTEP